MTPRALHGLAAPAKINLFLHVVGRRSDGYHLLQSAFVMLDWADTLHFERRDDGRLQRHDLGVRLPADDLCLRAARALQQASGCPWGVDISIDKQLPWGAGLGGGSSDAATTLLALNRLWGLRWPRSRLLPLALTLGADVPFFVGGRNAFVEGIGEQLLPMSWPETAYAVVKPPQALATREIFEHPGLRRDTAPAIVAGSSEEADRSGLSATRLQEIVSRLVEGPARNDLQPVAEDRCPEVAQAARWLASRYGNSRMTGSGSAVFSRVGATDASATTGWAVDLKGLPPGWVGRLCRSLAEHPLVGWAD